MRNVFLVLYNLAFSKVYLQDFSSVENFKKEVYEIIRLANSDVITNYFVAKLSEDLNLDADKIKQEIDSIKPIYSENNNYVRPVEVINAPVLKRKVVKITPNVIMAYNTIIKQSIDSRELLSVFFENLSFDGNLRYPGNKLAVQYDLLYILCEYYASNENKDGMGIELFLEILKDKPSSLELAIKIANDKFISSKNVQLFEDSINTIKDYFNKLDNAASYNAALLAQGQDEIDRNAVEFIEISKTQKKIVNEEDI